MQSSLIIHACFNAGYQKGLVLGGGERPEEGGGRGFVAPFEVRRRSSQEKDNWEPQSYVWEHKDLHVAGLRADHGVSKSLIQIHFFSPTETRRVAINLLQKRPLFEK